MEGPSTISVSVVVPARNAASYVLEQMEALRREIESVPAEVILVDDHSHDDTAAVVREWAMSHAGVPLLVLRSDKRRGPNGSRNAGAFHSRADRVAFADGDDVVQPGWLDTLMSVHEANAIVTGVAEREGRTYIPQHYARRPSVLGSALLVSRDVIERVGGFDRRLMQGGTEVEFALRCQLATGVEVVLAPTARTYYRRPAGEHGRARRERRREHGHCYLARKFADESADPKRTALILAAKGTVISFARAVTRNKSARRGELEQAKKLFMRTWWIARFRIHLPSAQLWDESLRCRYRVVYDSR